MRKPPNLTRKTDTFPIEFNSSSQLLNLQVNLEDNNGTFSADFEGSGYLPGPQADWAQTDETAPDFIKNKDIAEQLRPILVNGKVFLSEKRSSGHVNIVAGKNITFITKENELLIESSDTLYDLPPAMADRLGGIKSAKDIEGEIALNKVYVDENTGIGEVRAISTDVLVQGEEELVLNGGNASIANQ